MNTRQVRVVMPEPLYYGVKRHSAGNNTRFILEAIQEKIHRLEWEELERDLAEGYRVRSEERLQRAEEQASLTRECLGLEKRPS